MDDPLLDFYLLINVQNSFDNKNSFYVSFVQICSSSNTGSIRDDPYWTSRKNSLELIELSVVTYFTVKL